MPAPWLREPPAGSRHQEAGIQKPVEKSAASVLPQLERGGEVDVSRAQELEPRVAAQRMEGEQSMGRAADHDEWICDLF